MTPTKTREVKYVGKREVERLFGAIPPKEVRDALLLDVIYRYGLRREEATLLRVEHVRERVRVTRVKHGISRDYPIFPRTRRLLWTYLSRRGKDDNPYLFASSQVEGAPISTSLVYQLFHRYAEAAGLPGDRRHPHVLRHSIAVHLLNAGWDLVDVQHWLGHASITSTLIYAQVSNYRINKQFRALRSSQIAAL